MNLKFLKLENKKILKFYLHGKESGYDYPPVSCSPCKTGTMLRISRTYKVNNFAENGKKDLSSITTSGIVEVIWKESHCALRIILNSNTQYVATIFPHLF